MPIKKKKPRIIERVTIEKVGHGGVGISTAEDGRKILVQGGVLPGSIVDVIVHKSKKDFFEGRVFFVHTLSPEYATQAAPCPHYQAPGSTHADPQDAITTGCGGCKWQQVDYSKQLTLKTQINTDSFRHAAVALASAAIAPILPSPIVWGYRNKIEYSFGDYKSQGVHNTRSLGFHKQGQFSQIVDIHECLLVSPAARKLFAYMKKLCRDSGLPTYNHVTQQGCFRHLVIREGFRTGQFLINLSVNTDTILPEMRTTLVAFYKQLTCDTYLRETVTTCIISLNNGLGDTVWSPTTQQTVLRGDGSINESLTLQRDGKEDTTTYRISPQSFFQTNTHGAEVLFSQAARLIGDITGPLIDMYCGAGTIGIALHKLGVGDTLVGIEIVPEAIHDAHHNAALNGMTDAYFVAGKAEKLIATDSTFMRACHETQCIIVDPPRDGLHPDVVTFLTDLRRQRAYKLLYISCNPVTLARDIAGLTSEGGFTAQALQPVDMFPHTHHIENICLLA